MGLKDLFKGNKKTGSPKKKADDPQLVKSLFEKAYHEIKLETEVSCILMKLSDAKPSLFESKVGGLGYVPHDGNIPTNSKGDQLRLLAQIECKKVHLDEFPKQGLLQFWILNDDSYGADFDNGTKQENFRIVYHSEIDETVTKKEVKAKIVPNEYEKEGVSSNMPISGEYALTFAEGIRSMTDYDCRYNKIFCEKYNQMNPPSEIKSLTDLDFSFEDMENSEGEYDMNDAFGHKIGGYPAFTQYDPRNEENDPHDFLLLQLDSDYEVGGKSRLMWGDSGVANFFINTESLKKLDFSDVLYNWDCY